MQMSTTIMQTLDGLQFANFNCAELMSHPKRDSSFSISRLSTFTY